jgi:hypothetical protein
LATGQSDIRHQMGDMHHYYILVKQEVRPGGSALDHSRSETECRGGAIEDAMGARWSAIKRKSSAVEVREWHGCAEGEDKLERVSTRKSAGKGILERVKGSGLKVGRERAKASWSA